LTKDEYYCTPRDVLKAIKEVTRNPYDIFNANPQHHDLLLDDADEDE